MWWYYMKNWARRLATPITMRRMWKQAEGQRNSPLRLRAFRWTAEGKTNTRAKPHVAPEYLHERTHTLGNYSNYNTYNFVFHYLQVGLEKWESVKSFFVCLFGIWLFETAPSYRQNLFFLFFLCNISAHTHTWSEIFFGGKINKQTKSLFFKLISSWKSLYQFICILLDSICPYSCRFFFQLTIDL